MGTVGRAAITVGAALLVGAHTYATAFDLHADGTRAAIIDSTPVTLAVVFLAIITAALVDRWWAISVALVPLAVEWYLHEMTDYNYPFHEDPYPGMVLIGTVMVVGLALAAFLIRRGVAQAAKDLRGPNQRA